MGDSWAQPSYGFSDLMGRWGGHTGKMKKDSSCNLGEIISVEERGDLQESRWCGDKWLVYIKADNLTDLQNIFKFPGDSQRYLVDYGKRMNFLYMRSLGIMALSFGNTKKCGVFGRVFPMRSDMYVFINTHGCQATSISFLFLKLFIWK